MSFKRVRTCLLHQLIARNGTLMDGFLGFCFTQFNAMIVLPVNDSSSNPTTKPYKNVRFLISLLPFFGLSFSSHRKKKEGTLLTPLISLDSIVLTTSFPAFTYFDAYSTLNSIPMASSDGRHWGALGTIYHERPQLGVGEFALMDRLFLHWS